MNKGNGGSSNWQRHQQGSRGNGGRVRGGAARSTFRDFASGSTPGPIRAADASVAPGRSQPFRSSPSPYGDGPSRPYQNGGNNFRYQRFRTARPDHQHSQQARPSQANNQYRNNGQWRGSRGQNHPNKSENRYKPNSSCVEKPLQPNVRSTELSDLPGFSYDPNTGKYYRVLPDQPGQPRGSTMQDLKRMERESKHLQRLAISSNNHGRTFNQVPLVNLLGRMELCSGASAGSNASRIRRSLEEGRLTNAKNTPSYTFEVNGEAHEQFVGCQFLDICQDGRTLVGCWAVNGMDEYRSSSRIMCHRVSIDPEEALTTSRRYQEGESMVGTNGKYACNTYGLRFQPVGHSIYLVDPSVVDMTIAPADTDVTCVLYATANSHYSASHGIVTACSVFFKPIIELTKDEGQDVVNSPIYNFELKTSEPVWSCAFNSSKMQIGIGLEKCASVFDVVSEQNFRVSSGGKNVVAQQFSSDGTLLYLGRRNANMSCLDLRLSQRHTVGEFEDSTSTGFIYQMRHRPNYVLSENFLGNIRLWDVRTRRCVLSMEGHKNSHHRVPCFVDSDERFLFAGR